MRVQNPLASLARLVVRRDPLDAQLIITRRCNLSCGYCSEYDHSSAPVPLDALRSRLDAIHRLRALNITLLGGEPLMHPDLVAIVEHAAKHAQVSITTNGFLLTQEIIERLNGVGLSNIQLSVDLFGKDPSGYVQKSWATLRPKLRLLQRYATFDVHVNVVLCEGTKTTFSSLWRELGEMGLRVSVDILHDHNGLVQIGGPDYVALWDELFEKGTPLSYAEHGYGRQLLSGERPKWKCRAGARMLYVDEFGKVQHCSAQRGRLDAPIESYTARDLRVQWGQHKGCEEGCAVLCGYRDSLIDNRPVAAIGAFIRLISQGGLSSRARVPEGSTALSSG
ncbi:MAG TPA: radical SAM protein [Gemmatimonadaceae bacterium]|nr:radical SAM protein [Gemmatimonadaceae bacterium]